MSSEWTCALHGMVSPLHPPHPPATSWLHTVARRSSVPVWLPWPLPTGWLLSGLAEAGSAREGTVASVVACSGPNPAPHPDAPQEHPAEMLLVAESPGVGLGAHLAGLDDVDPGVTVASGPAHAKVRAAGHPSPLWLADGSPECAAYVGESAGVWLWVLLWPATAGVLLLDDLRLLDVREARDALDPPVGAPSPRLA